MVDSKVLEKVVMSVKSDIHNHIKCFKNQGRDKNRNRRYQQTVFKNILLHKTGAKAKRHLG